MPSKVAPLEAAVPKIPAMRCMRLFSFSMIPVPVLGSSEVGRAAFSCPSKRLNFYQIDKLFILHLLSKIILRSVFI